MQGRQDDAENHEWNKNLLYNFERLLQVEALQNDGRELERQHSRVEHDAVRHLKHHRVRIPHDERMPDVVWLAEVIHEGDADQRISEECRQNRWADDRMQPPDVQDVHRRCECESPSREHDTAENVEADPDSPRELIAQVSGGAETLREAEKCSVQPRRHQKEENQFPESRGEISCCGPLPFYSVLLLVRRLSSFCDCHFFTPVRNPPKATECHSTKGNEIWNMREHPIRQHWQRIF